MTGLGLGLDERGPYGIAVRLEYRSDLANYTQSTILHPANGKPMCSAHWGFVGAALRHLFAPIAEEVTS